MKPHDMRPHTSPGGSRRRRPPVIATRRMVALTGGLCASPGGMVLIRHLSAGSAGSGSPLLYSTGDIQVNNVSGTSSGSQIAGMEGLNTILIKDSTLESTVTGKTASDPIATASSSTSPPRATRKPAPASTPRSSRSIPHSAPPSDQGRCSTSPTRPPMWCCRTLSLISTPTRRRSRTTRRPAPAQARRATSPSL